MRSRSEKNVNRARIALSSTAAGSGHSPDAEFKRELQKLAAAQGFARVGVAPACLPAAHAGRLQQWLAAGMHGEMAYMSRNPAARTDASSLLEGARSVLVFAASYLPEDQAYCPAPTPEAPCRTARFALGRDYHFVLREKLVALLQWLDAARPGNSWTVCIDSAPLLERAFAAEAGVGFFGRNTMLIAPGLGSHLFLAEIITTALIEPDQPVAGTCGRCSRCVDACPAGAITPPYCLNATRCISYLTIEKKTELTADESGRLNGWVFGCDVCQDVCPYNRAAAASTMAEFSCPAYLRTAEPAATFTQAASVRQFRRLFAFSPLLRAGCRRIQRNAQLAQSQADRTCT